MIFHLMGWSMNSGLGFGILNWLFMFHRFHLVLSSFPVVSMEATVEIFSGNEFKTGMVNIFEKNFKAVTKYFRTERISPSKDQREEIKGVIRYYFLAISFFY